MKRRIPERQLPKPDVNLSDAQSIDATYGLEPVIDPSNVSADDGGGPDGMQFHWVECPYCSESFETPVDTSSGSARYVEDCQICCQPIEFSLEVDYAGVFQSLSTLRSDQ
jgi:Cysteine-rich CPXCG